MTSLLDNELVRKIEAIYKILMDKHVCIWGHGTQHVLCDHTCHCVCKPNPDHFQEGRGKCDHNGYLECRRCGVSLVSKPQSAPELPEVDDPTQHCGWCNKRCAWECQCHGSKPSAEKCGCKDTEYGHDTSCQPSDKVEEKIKEIAGYFERGDNLQFKHLLMVGLENTLREPVRLAEESL